MYANKLCMNYIQYRLTSRQVSSEQFYVFADSHNISLVFFGYFGTVWNTRLTEWDEHNEWL